MQQTSKQDKVTYLYLKSLANILELEKQTLQGFKNVIILNINKSVTANFKKLNKKN